MPKKILLIESDQALAARLSDFLEDSGFHVRATGDGKEGLDLARDWTPEAIVLCVELASMSGYLVCQKLKKDDALKGISLVLTSAEATEETFEKHKTLKARADDYLLKPYEPQALLRKLASLVGLPEPTAAADAPGETDEELVSLEMGLEGAEGEPDAELSGLMLESLPEEETASAASPGMDEDLRLLDDAFDGLSAPAAAEDAAAALDELTGEKPMAGDEVDAAADTLPDDDERAGLPDLGGLDDEAEAALGALSGVDETLSPGLTLAGSAPRPAAARPVRGASADLLHAAGLKLLDDSDEPGPAIVTEPPDLGALAGGGAQDDLRDALGQARQERGDRDAELRDLRRKVEALAQRADHAEAELAQAKSRVEAAQEKARKAEADGKAGRDEARRAAEQARTVEAEVAELRRKASDAERRAADAEKKAAAAEQEARRKAEDASARADAIARTETLEREATELRTELLVARGEADGARGEVDRRTADLRKRVADLDAANAKNEERVVKAYQKIKADEKVRDKVRKALAIATQLLEEGLPAESAAEKERRAASALGRE
jgi:CheY-like chemotaxis protein